MAHSRTKNLDAVCRSADILCAAVGRAELIKGEWVKEGATVIDVGINRAGSGDTARLIGDVEFAAAATRAGAITPVPGGVGPMTIACLLRNTALAAARRRGLADPGV
jgi:methylenetetrahydrofolate dehydrogenase (NADP+)/methenyltetrahydrofolate cyclohydrolase